MWLFNRKTSNLQARATQVHADASSLASDAQAHVDNLTAAQVEIAQHIGKASRVKTVMNGVLNALGEFAGQAISNIQ